jgi:hypothetical protein
LYSIINQPHISAPTVRTIYFLFLPYIPSMRAIALYAKTLEQLQHWCGSTLKAYVSHETVLKILGQEGRDTKLLYKERSFYLGPKN